MHESKLINTNILAKCIMKQNRLPKIHVLIININIFIYIKHQTNRFKLILTYKYIESIKLKIIKL